MTVTVEIPQEIEAGLLAEAQAQGLPVAEYLRHILVEYYEDREDRRIAQERLTDRQPPISSSQMRKNLGLDD